MTIKLDNEITTVGEVGSKYGSCCSFLISRLGEIGPEKLAAELDFCSVKDLIEYLIEYQDDADALRSLVQESYSC
ncbi:hypothetical protein [Lactobacillus mulieris]|jgi:hypothetical protein|uniref:DUF433 domain-containing protein n=1 Tax=Lactobacillus mulieris TaxID=2508708 RepID=A0ABT4K173_9LACO|nr:hypothetical protein [Lactobacillus mulieris]MCZ3621887.1 hypothetical protein [Lactobacillus mulieris]MCZ3623584.1 hypothetical protein [Lactobacillus mulieris]MCZ3635894.1 hypothetical protein [Lactobacillus mulieris]